MVKPGQIDAFAIAITAGQIAVAGPVNQIGVVIVGQENIGMAVLLVLVVGGVDPAKTVLPANTKLVSLFDNLNHMSVCALYECVQSLMLNNKQAQDWKAATIARAALPDNTEPTVAWQVVASAGLVQAESTRPTRALGLA